jgi:hypothetical protein
MAGGFSLGNFGGQLTADELRRALAATGGNPDALDFGEPQLPPAASEPALAPPPEPVQAPAEAAPLPAEPPPDMSVQRASGGPQRAIRTYQDENLADANKRIEIAGRSGDASGMDAQAYDEQAAVRGRQAEQSRAGIDEARGRVNERREHEQRYQQEADRLYEDMRQHAQPPPQSTVSKVLGIVGAVAGMAGKGGVASGLGMLSGMLGSDQDRWAQEQAANSGLYKAALMSVGSDREGMSSDLDVAQRMAVLEAHEIDASLEQVKAMGLSRNATRTAEDLQLGMRQKVREGLAAMEAQKAAAAAKSRAAQAEDPLWRMPLDALKQLNAGGGLSEQGQKVLQQRVANDQKDRGGEADIRKKLGEAGTGEGQEVLPGLVATVPLEKKDVSDIRANAQVLSKIRGNYEQLIKIRERNKGNPISAWTNRDDRVLAQNVISEMTGVMNQFAGRGAPSNLELDDMKKQLLDPTDNYVLTDPKAVYKAQIKRLENNFNAGLSAIGVRNADGSEVRTPEEKKAYNFKPATSQPGKRTAQQLARDLLERNEGIGSGGV